jgi:two-component system chemotaxis sensor kinase CheA
MAALSVTQIRALFAQEAEGRLIRLSQLLLELEGAQQDENLIRSVFREIHTLKGSSAVAGLDEVSRVAHELEGPVDDLRSGRRPVTPDVIDRLLAGVDRLSAAIAAGLQDGWDAGAVSPPIVAAAVSNHEAHGSVAVLSAPVVRHGEPAPSPITTAFAAPNSPLRPPPRAPAAGGGAVMVQMERLDELVGLLGEAAAAHLRVGRMLKDRFGVDPASCAEFNELSRSVNVLQDRVMRTRMVPVGTITDQLHRAVRDIARTQGKDIRWQVEGADTELDRGVLNQLSDSLLHLVRNAVDHGIEPADQRSGNKAAHGTIRLHARQLGSEVIIAVSDDGRGIDTQQVRERATRLGIDTADLSADEALQLIFRSGLSTTAFVTDVSGRGVGLDVVMTNIEAVRGRIEVHSEPGSGTEFRIVVPITLAVLRCLLVEAGGHRFALPFHRVLLSQAHEPSRVIEADGRAMVWVDDQPVTVSTLVRTLGIADSGPSVGPIVVLTDTTRRHAFQVDRLVGQRDVVLKGLSRLLPHLPAVAGASIEPDGSIFVVLDPPGLIGRARHLHRAIEPPPVADSSHGPRRRILVVDDALTVRELQRSILLRAGFDVRVAIDGLQALAKLADEPVDLVLTDIEMPNMDGFALTTAIRAHATLANIPVLILSSRSSEADRQRGLDVGADGYIIKSGFDESNLLAAVNRLLGAMA